MGRGFEYWFYLVPYLKPYPCLLNYKNNFLWMIWVGPGSDYIFISNVFTGVFKEFWCCFLLLQIVVVIIN